MSGNYYKEINEIYKDPEQGLVGEALLYKRVKAKHPEISRKNIKDYLKQQEEHVEHVELKKNKESFNRTRANSYFESVQIDLIDLSRYKGTNKGYNYLFILVDVYSRKTFLFPIKTKSPKEIAPYLKSLFSSEGYPKNVTSDEGSEFRGEVEALMTANKIPYYPTLRKETLGILNRKVREVRKIIKKIDKFQYADKLTQIMNNLNNTENRTTGATANDIQKKIKKPTVTSTEPKVNLKYEVGDKVKIKEQKNSFSTHHKPTYSKESYLIFSIRGNSYILLDLETEEIVEDERGIVSFTADMLRKIDSQPYRLIEIMEKKRKKAVAKRGAKHEKKKESESESENENIKQKSKSNRDYEREITNERKQQRFLNKEDLDLNTIVQGKRNKIQRKLPI